MARRMLYSVIKRGTDIAGGAALLALSSPVMLAIGIMIRAESPGKVIFVHRRVGRNGRPIRVFKFRSMKEGSEDLEAALNDEDLERYYQEYKLKDDPRVTETGRKLRRTSLDELPQLVNVIQGSMSLVGPRPVLPGELSFYYTEEEQKTFLSVKPGITGYWQVHGRSSVTYQSHARQEMELYYAENASLRMDASILLKTVGAILRGRGAY